MPRHNFARPRGRLTEIALDSKALAGNLLGDPATRSCAVYLPPGYAASGKHYPVLYMHDGQNLFDDATSYAGEWGVDESLDALAKDGYGPAFLARIHPRFHTPAAAIVVQFVISLALALSGSFAGLALLSMVTRLLAYIGTAAAVLVLARRYRDRPGALKLPGGPLIPALALLLSVGLLLSASWQNLLAVGVALSIGALIYLFPRKQA